jgi:hypothetical protein
MNQHLGAAILFNEFTAFIFAVLTEYEFCGAVEVEIIHVLSSYFSIKLKENPAKKRDFHKNSVHKRNQTRRAVYR